MDNLRTMNHTHLPSISDAELHQWYMMMPSSAIGALRRGCVEVGINEYMIRQALDTLKKPITSDLRPDPTKTYPCTPTSGRIEKIYVSSDLDPVIWGPKIHTHEMPVYEPGEVWKTAVLPDLSGDPLITEAQPAMIWKRNDDFRPKMQTSTTAEIPLPNHVKGEIGESFVLTAAQRIWQTAAFEKTAGASAMSDFHLVTAHSSDKSTKSHRIVFECKNKKIVTASDVAKSVRDMTEIRSLHPLDFAAYAFVSIDSRAIPGKGALHFEIVDVGRPLFVAWLGIAASEDLQTAQRELDYFLICVQKMTAVMVEKLISAVGGSSDSAIVDEASRVIAKAMEAVKPLAEQKKAIEEMRKTVLALSKQFGAVDVATKAMYDLFSEYIVRVEGLTTFSCPRCNKTYKLEHAFNKHVTLCVI